MNWQGPNSGDGEHTIKETKQSNTAGDKTKPVESKDSQLPPKVASDITKPADTPQAKQAQLNQVKYDTAPTGKVTPQTYKTPEGQTVQALNSYDQKTGQTITSLPKSDGSGWTQYVRDQNTLRPLDGGPVLKVSNDGQLKPDNTIAPPLNQKSDTTPAAPVAQKPEAGITAPQPQRSVDAPIQPTPTVNKAQPPSDIQNRQQQPQQQLNPTPLFNLSAERNQTVISDPKVVAAVVKPEHINAPVAEQKTQAPEIQKTVAKPDGEMRQMSAPKLGLPNESITKAMEMPGDKAIKGMLEEAQRNPITAHPVRPESAQGLPPHKESAHVADKLEPLSKRPDVIDQKTPLADKGAKPGFDIAAALLGVIATGKAGDNSGAKGAKPAEVKGEKTPTAKPPAIAKPDDKSAPKNDAKPGDKSPDAPHGKIDSKLLAQLQEFKQERFQDVKTLGVVLISKFQENKLQPSGAKEDALGKLFESMKPEHLVGLKNWLSSDMKNPIDFKMLDLKTQQTISKIFDLLETMKGEIKPQANKRDFENLKEAKPISKETDGTKPSSKNAEVTKPSIRTQTFAADSANRKPESKDAQIDTSTRPIAAKDEIKAKVDNLKDADNLKEETRIMAPLLSPELQSVLKAKQEKAEEEIEKEEEKQRRWEISLGNESKYRVKAGDTLASIARTVFNNADLAESLFEHNKNEVFVAYYEKCLFTIVLKGQVLKIPSRKTIAGFKKSSTTNQSIQFDKQFENTNEGLVSIFGASWRQVLSRESHFSRVKPLRDPRTVKSLKALNPIEYAEPKQENNASIENDVIAKRKNKDRKTKTKTVQLKRDK